MFSYIKPYSTHQIVNVFVGDAVNKRKRNSRVEDSIWLFQIILGVLWRHADRLCGAAWSRTSVFFKEADELNQMFNILQNV